MTTDTLITEVSIDRPLRQRGKQMPMPVDRLQKFKDVVEKLDEVNIILTQVDPDAVGSAIGLSEVLSYLNVRSKIHYCGNFGHPQNRSISNKFNLKSLMSPIPRNKDDAFEYCKDMKNIALVDSSQVDDSRLGCAIDPIIVVDHHRGATVVEADDNFIWVEDVGSASTLIIELIRSLNEEVDDEDAEIDFKNNKRLSVLLTLGIYTDTGALVSASQRDRDSYGFATEHVTPEDLRQLIDYTLPASHYRNMRRAAEELTEKDSRLVASLGVISSEEGDDLSTIAEWYIRKDGISMAVVWGIVKGKANKNSVVRISARNKNLSVPLDEFIKTRFGSGGAKLSPAGLGEGGATLDLGVWLGKDNLDDVRTMVGKRINEIIFSDLTDEVG